VIERGCSQSLLVIDTKPIVCENAKVAETQDYMVVTRVEGEYYS